MIDKLTKLIDVKTIITLAIVATIIFLGIKGSIESDKVYQIGLIVLAFYFGKGATPTDVK